MAISRSPDITSIAAEPPADVQRFNLAEILIHWLTVGAFIVALGTGLPLAYPRIFWLTDFFGGPQATREVHPWAGIAFSGGFLLMTIAWVRDMLPEKGDADWLGHLKEYVTMQVRQLDIGRFNPGQKMFYWVTFLATVALFVTGLFLWQTDWAGVTARSWMRLFHNVPMVVIFGMFLLHVYMAAAMYPGTLGSMVHGRVTRGWALLHHARWYRKRSGGQ